MHKNFAAVALLQTPLGYFWRMEVLTVGGRRKREHLCSSTNFMAPQPSLFCLHIWVAVALTTLRVV